MGKALLILVLGFSTIFSTITLNLSRQSLESVENYSNHFKNAVARNGATSGVYMALSKLYQNDSWRAGFQNLTLSQSNCTVALQDNSDDPTLSEMELRIVSISNYEDISKTIEVVVGIPPKLNDLAVFCTDTIDNVSIYNESGNLDPSLAIQNAPEMLPFDKDGLVTLAVSQGHVHSGDFEPDNNYPDSQDSNSDEGFYYNSVDKIPDVTHVQGNFTINGGRTVYGIYVIEGNAVLDGSSRLEGVLYLPNPGSIVIHGGGNPNESNVTGGVFANGYISGTGNHISIRYYSEYMQVFGEFQTVQNLFIVSWKESPEL